MKIIFNKLIRIDQMYKKEMKQFIILMKKI